MLFFFKCPHIYQILTPKKEIQQIFVWALSAYIKQQTELSMASAGFTLQSKGFILT
jgi:hypothetical protein